MRNRSLFRIIATALVFYCTPVTTRAQQIPYPASFTAVDTVCPWNDLVSINTTVGWIAYQTTDNTYNGPVDSNICVSLKVIPGFSGMSFAPEDFDTTRALFLKADLNAANKIPLETDASYMVYEDLAGYIPSLDLTTDCPETMCTGMIIGVEIPDSTFTGTTTRWTFVNSASFEGGFCFPTEKFSDMYLTDCILKLTFNAPDDTIKIYGSPYMELVWDQTLITDMTETPGTYVGADYVINSWDFIPTTVGILKFDDPEYPSTDHFDFVEVSPDPNPASPVNINIEINEYQTLMVQPYVQLRGAFAEGDTVRHTVNLINNGGRFCLSIAEMIFSGDTHYRFHSGEFEMFSPQACVMFRDGASIIVDDSAYLSYGKKGVGVLGLGSGGTIEIGKNATLEINNRVSIIKDESEGYPRDIYMNLNTGSKLIFGEGASVTNDDKNSSGAHICIYMNGGEVELNELSEDSRALVRLIWPAASEDLSDKINIYPNPANEKFTAEIQCDKNCSALLQLNDFSGKTKASWNIELKAGMNAIPVPVRYLESGIYMVTLQCDGMTGNKKFVKL